MWNICSYWIFQLIRSMFKFTTTHNINKNLNESIYQTLIIVSHAKCELCWIKNVVRTYQINSNIPKNIYCMYSQNTNSFKTTEKRAWKSQMGFKRRIKNLVNGGKRIIINGIPKQKSWGKIFYLQGSLCFSWSRTSRYCRDGNLNSSLNT